MPSNLMKPIFGLLKLVWVVFLAVEVHRGTKIYNSKKAEKTLAVAPTDPHCTIGTKIETMAVHVTSLADLLRCYGANKKTRTLVSTIL